MKTRPQPRSPYARAARRLVLGVLAFVVLGGPAPGFVGSCAPSTNEAPDAYRFCTDKQGLVCGREYESGRIDAVQFDACYDQIPAVCETRRTWSDCVPTSAATQACLNALSDRERFAIPSNEIVECNTLCPSGI